MVDDCLAQVTNVLIDERLIDAAELKYDFWLNRNTRSAQHGRLVGLYDDLGCLHDDQPKVTCLSFCTEDVTSVR